MCMSWKIEPIQAEGLDTRKSPGGRRNISVYHGSGLFMAPFVYGNHLFLCVIHGFKLALLSLNCFPLRWLWLNLGVVSRCLLNSIIIILLIYVYMWRSSIVFSDLIYSFIWKYNHQRHSISCINVLHYYNDGFGPIFLLDNICYEISIFVGIIILPCNLSNYGGRGLVVLGMVIGWRKVYFTMEILLQVDWLTEYRMQPWGDFS